MQCHFLNRIEFIWWTWLLSIALWPPIATRFSCTLWRRSEEGYPQLFLHCWYERDALFGCLLWHAFTKALALESIGSGVTIQEVAPGAVQSALPKYYPGEPSASFPAADQFVVSALAALGSSWKPCGWWAPSASKLFLQMFPEWMKERRILMATASFY